MLKAAFAFGIMNCIFFACSAFFLMFMYRQEKEVVVKETYRRSSHGSRYIPHAGSFFVETNTDDIHRRGHSRSGSGHHHRSSRDSRRNYYV